MIDSGSKHPENRIHLFDPVALINDGYGAARYKSSTNNNNNNNNNNNVVVKPNRPTKSYANNFEEEVHTNGGLVSYDHVSTLTSTDRISSDSFSMETNGVQLGSQNGSPNPAHDYSHGGGLGLGLGLTFGVDKSNGLEGDSDDSTPRLWKPLNNSSSSHPASPKSKNSSPFDHVNSSATMSLSQPSSPSNKHGYHQSLSPNSRTQAIAKGRRELMDMVKDLPESFYELSLRDIVEQKAEFGVQKGVIVIPEEHKTTLPSTELEEKKKEKERKNGKKVKKSESKKKMVRSRSIDNGRFLLRTSVFPIFPGSRKSKKNLGGSTSFKVAPMGKGEPGSSGVVKGSGEKDWWRRKSCISSESGESNVFSSKDTSSSGSSSSSSLSSSINGRHSNRFLPICCLFNGRKIASKK